MSYVAPDGNTYKYYIQCAFHNMKIYSNRKMCFCKNYKYTEGSRIYYYAIALGFVDSQSFACYIASNNYSYDSNLTKLYPSNTGADPSNNSDYKVFSGTSIPTTNSVSNALVTDNPNVILFDTIEEAYAYLTAPEVFQIPSFSFSGSITLGQNSSLTQGSCSLASPYTTSFSFEGKYRDLV